MVNMQPDILWLLTAVPTLCVSDIMAHTLNQEVVTRLLNVKPGMAHVYIISQPRNSNGAYLSHNPRMGLLQYHT